MNEYYRHFCNGNLYRFVTFATIEAAREEDIALHGRPTSFRKALHKSKKIYDRKKFKKLI